MRNKNIKQRIKEFFFINPSSRMRVRQIEKELGLPLPSVIRYCRELEKEGVLKLQRIGNVNFYIANRTSDKFLLEKRLFNLKQLYESGLIDYLKVRLVNSPIIVFGSFARGEDIEESDIDLYIETPSKKDIVVEEYETVLERKIHIFRLKSIGEIKNKHLANNILNGIVLNGFIEVFK